MTLTTILTLPAAVTVALLATAALAEPPPADGVPLPAADVAAFYSGKSWAWDDGGVYFAADGTVVAASRNATSQPTAAVGTWRSEDGRVCYDVTWTTVSGQSQGIDCWQMLSNQVRGQPAIWQVNAAGDAWVVSRGGNIDRNFTVGDRITPLAAAARQNLAVRCVQQQLTDLGQQPGPVDGALGRRTQAALAAYVAKAPADLPPLTTETAGDWCARLLADAVASRNEERIVGDELAALLFGRHHTGTSITGAPVDARYDADGYRLNGAERTQIVGRIENDQWCFRQPSGADNCSLLFRTATGYASRNADGSLRAWLTIE